MPSETFATSTLLQKKVLSDKAFSAAPLWQVDGAMTRHYYVQINFSTICPACRTCVTGKYVTIRKQNKDEMWYSSFQHMLLLIINIYIHNKLIMYVLYTILISNDFHIGR